jgi:hypothetical protein
MYEWKLMGVNKHKQARDSITRKWVFLTAICTLPIWGLYAYLGDPGRGQAAWVSSAMICLAARFYWDLRKYVWFWVTITLIVLVHVPLIVLIPWPFKQLTYIAALSFGYADFGIAYGIIQLAENIVERNSKEKNNDSVPASTE